MNCHALSFDVENWYDGNLYREAFQGTQDSRVVSETSQVLGVLMEHGVKATFFVLGRVAQQHPELVRQVSEAGHEVACHGYEHLMVSDLTPRELREDLARARGLLQDLSGQSVDGFRAPSWSIDTRSLQWAPAVIAAAGFRYDSSVFPMRTPLYGVSGAPLRPWFHAIPGGGHLLELPPAVAKVGPVRVPFGGGIYWRILPEWLICRMLERAGEPMTLYLHPWELNAQRVPAGPEISMLRRMVLTVGIHRAKPSLGRMLRRFRFDTIRNVFAAHIAQGVAECAGLNGSSDGQTAPTA